MSGCSVLCEIESSTKVTRKGLKCKDIVLLHCLDKTVVSRDSFSPPDSPAGINVAQVS